MESIKVFTTLFKSIINTKWGDVLRIDQPAALTLDELRWR